MGGMDKVLSGVDIDVVIFVQIDYIKNMFCVDFLQMYDFC